MTITTEQEKRFINKWEALSEKERQEFKDFLAKDMTMKLPTGNVITFNNEQYEGILKARKWLNKPNAKFFTLAGYAGTGKSTIIKKIIDEYRKNIVVSAPTHKAKKVVIRTTQEVGETLHALLGLRPDTELDDFNPNDPKFSQIAEARIAAYNLVIIDEASMINEELFKLIESEIKYLDHVKVLFMGDIAQIPPVGEKLSIVFCSEIGEVHELTKVMRQKDGNPLFPIYDKLRNNLRDFFGGITRKTNINDKGEGVIFTKNREEFRDHLFRKFNSKEFRVNIDHARLIAWRNKTVMQSNKIIRESIYGKECRYVEVGDLLMAYRSIRSPRQYYNILDNAADYTVENVSKFMQNEYGLGGHTVKISETHPDGRIERRNIFIIDHTDHENLHDYAEIHDALKTMALTDKKLWNKYYSFRRNSILMVTIDKYRKGAFRDKKEKIKKDIDYGYAITAHKCQGSTYDHVFVLEDDMSLNPKIKERNQIKYVALTRPTTSAIVFTTMN